MTIVYRRFKCPKCGYICEQKARAAAHVCPKAGRWVDLKDEEPDDD